MNKPQTDAIRCHWTSANRADPTATLEAIAAGIHAKMARRATPPAPSEADILTWLQAEASAGRTPGAAAPAPAPTATPVPTTIPAAGTPTPAAPAAPGVAAPARAATPATAGRWKARAKTWAPWVLVAVLAIILGFTLWGGNSPKSTTPTGTPPLAGPTAAPGTPAAMTEADRKQAIIDELKAYLPEAEKFVADLQTEASKVDALVKRIGELADPKSVDGQKIAGNKQAVEDFVRMRDKLNDAKTSFDTGLITSALTSANEELERLRKQIADNNGWRTAREVRLALTMHSIPLRAEVKKAEALSNELDAIIASAASAKGYASALPEAIKKLETDRAQARLVAEREAAARSEDARKRELAEIEAVRNQVMSADFQAKLRPLTAWVDDRNANPGMMPGPVSMSELWKIVTKGINKPLMEQGLDTQDWAQAYENFVNFTKSHNYLAFRAPFPGIGDKMETISFLFILFQQKAQAFVVVDGNPLRTADENKLRR